MSKATWRTTAGTAAVAGALALPGGAAYAQTSPPPTVNPGGPMVAIDQSAIPSSIPVGPCGIAVAILHATPVGDAADLLASANTDCPAGTATVSTAAPLPTSSPTLPDPPKHHQGRHRMSSPRGSAALASTAQNIPDSPALGGLPTTGVNVAGILAGALGLLGAGSGLMVAGRRRTARHAA